MYMPFSQGMVKINAASADATTDRASANVTNGSSHNNIAAAASSSSAWSDGAVRIVVHVRRAYNVCKVLAGINIALPRVEIILRELGFVKSKV